MQGASKTTSPGGSMEALFGRILFQANWYPFVLVLTIGIIVYMLPYKFQKLAASKAYQLLNFIALICILTGAINLGYWGSDHDWGRDKVRQDRQEEIRKLQELSRHR